MYGARTEVLLEQKDEYDKAREIMEGVVSRRFQRQGPDIANQIRVLKSRDLVAKAVGDLDHNITYFIVGRVRALPVGGLSGVEVEAFPEQFSNAALGADFDLNVIDDQSYSLSVNLGADRVYAQDHVFGEEVQTGDFRIIIRRAENGRGTIEQAIAQGQRFQVRNENQIINQYRGGLTVSGVGQTSILKLQISNILPDRAIEFLDALSVRYIEYSTAAREAVNRKTDEFLDLQLLKIEANVDSLQDIIDEQREEAKVLDLTRNEQAYFQELVQLETQREELRLKLRSLTSLESYLGRGVENTSIPPSAFLTQDAVAADQVGQLYDLQLQRTQMLLDVTPSSFQVKRLDSLLSTTRLSLFDYIGGARGALEEEAIDLDRRVKALEDQTVQSAQKRAELAGHRKKAGHQRQILWIPAGTAGDQPDRTGGHHLQRQASSSKRVHVGITGPDKPKTIRNYTLIGLAIAVGIALLRLFLFERIESVNELREATKLSVSGGIPRYEEISDKEYVLVSSKSPATRLQRLSGD